MAGLGVVIRRAYRQDASNPSNSEPSFSSRALIATWPDAGEELRARHGLGVVGDAGRRRMRARHASGMVGDAGVAG